ncbi:hypothetical protein [Paraburkholderia bannensis]|uniref:hypothetical protein n=1 Tax=Paraburkholderia bannensis TaxID=765414 RepID=UPI002AB2FAD8|nr:hypothetical protein [Paraburkholderia bannensis]
MTDLPTSESRTAETMHTRTPRFRDAWLFVIPTLFVLSTIVGAFRWFSPVPFWDMWEHTVRFYSDILDGRWSAFLDQANEHRILISYLLFWMDYRLFGGVTVFLITVNVALMAALWLCLYAAARSLLGGHQRTLIVSCALLVIPCFSWLQSENINWAFQSQFYLAYLLPLASMIFLARWMEDTRSHKHYVWALGCAVLASFTMANGLFALPLFIAMLVMGGNGTWRRTAAATAAMIVTFAAWSYHYGVVHHPIAPIKRIVEFLLIFLGGPIGLIFHSLLAGLIAGTAVLGACAFLAAHWLRGRVRQPMYLALLFFVAYVCAAGLAASIGRSQYGLDTALSGRYETPVLLLYSALFLMFVYLHRDRSATVPVICAVSVFTPLLMLTTQLDAVGTMGPDVARLRMQAALALNAGIDDRGAIARIYPQDDAIHVDLIHQIAASAIQHDISVFSLHTLKMARAAQGKSAQTLDIAQCLGHVDTMNTLPNDNQHVRLAGWAFDAKRRQVPEIAFIVSNGTVIGSVLTGIDRPDVRDQIDKKARRAGFDGYSTIVDQGTMSVWCPS